ncbi:MAG TPA: NAD(P)-binding domain-containing protein, partial [Rhizomicrobium sp.]|nr:NAD(P)-binding domain-containing protein [Rhizomicrobium sp.]
MGSALLKGWLNRGIKSISVVEPKPSAALRKLAQARKIALFAVPSEIKRKPSVCVVAIKPQVLKNEAPLLASFAGAGGLMISIAAGTSVAALAGAWGKKARII